MVNKGNVVKGVAAFWAVRKLIRWSLALAGTAATLKVLRRDDTTPAEEARLVRARRRQ